MGSEVRLSLITEQNRSSLTGQCLVEESAAFTNDSRLLSGTSSLPELHTIELILGRSFRERIPDYENRRAGRLTMVAQEMFDSIEALLGSTRLGNEKVL